jgi:hypothetical protein
MFQMTSTALQGAVNVPLRESLQSRSNTRVYVVPPTIHGERRATDSQMGPARNADLLTFVTGFLKNSENSLLIGNHTPIVHEH